MKTFVVVMMHLLSNFLIPAGILGCVLFIFQEFGQSVVIRIFEWAIYVYSLMLVVLGVIVLAFSFRMFPRDIESLQETKAFLLRNSHNSSGVIVFTSTAIGLILFILSIAMDLNWWSVALFCLAGAFWVSIRRRQPPMVLVLGNSSPAARRLYSAVRVAVMPNAVANLLDLAQESDRTISFVRVDTFRTIDTSWRQVVSTLADVARIVVVDIRAISPPVQEEIRILYQKKLQYKTLFIAGETASENIANMVRCVEVQGIPNNSVIIGESELIRLLRHVRSRPRDLPAPTRPLAALVTSMRGRESLP